MKEHTKCFELRDKYMEWHEHIMALGDFLLHQAKDFSASRDTLLKLTINLPIPIITTINSDIIQMYALFVCLFINGISTFSGYLMPTPSF